MRITITNEEGSVKAVDVDPSMELENVKALIEAELDIPAAQQSVYFNGQILQDDKKSLAAYKVGQDDILLVRQLVTGTGSSGAGSAASGLSRAEILRRHILANPSLLAQMSAQIPGLANAIQNPQEFARIIDAVERQREAEQRRQQEMAALDSGDPFDLDSQQRIMEHIRQQNILQNLETAMEYHPESFGRVTMLYINMTVNGHPIKAFVDSGAQATIMSPSCAEKCHVLHLLDERFAGIARGVGTAKILGRIHSTQIQVGSLFLPCSMTVMEGKSVDFLFGLDMLKRYQASIDLEKNVLRIGKEEVPFLAEHELPEQARLEALPDEESKETPSSEKVTATASTSSASAPKSNNTITSSTAAASKYPEATIKTLMDLGVSRAEAINALDACGGNAELAANMLFQL